MTISDHNVIINTRIEIRIENTSVRSHMRCGSSVHIEISIRLREREIEHSLRPQYLWENNYQTDSGHEWEQQQPCMDNNYLVGE